jgi:hypothetical protein
MNRLASVAATLFLFALVPVNAGAQSPGQDPATEGDVEVLGLRRWTVPMLVDSLRKYKPDVTLGDAACGVILRDSIGFQDAAVFRFRDGRVVLSIIEPWDSSRVALREAPDDGSVPEGPWIKLKDWREGDLSPIDYAAASFLRHRSGEEVAVEDADSSTVHDVWELLSRPAPASDLDAALAALATDSEPEVRRAVALYLVRYSDRDAAWRGLVAALRDPEWAVRTAAQASLRALRTSAGKKVDWAPAKGDLRHLLNGTTLVFHTEVVNLLLATETSAEMAREILSPAAAGLLLDELGARHEYVREPAHAFLKLAAEKDFGPDPAAWSEWEASLRGS